MKVVIRMTPREEERALPILLRLEPGIVLQDGTYILARDVVQALRESDIKYQELGSDALLTDVEVSASERV